MCSFEKKKLAAGLYMEHDKDRVILPEVEGANQIRRAFRYEKLETNSLINENASYVLGVLRVRLGFV